MAQRILDVVNELAGDLGIPIVTPEYEIMLLLLDAGSLGPDQLCSKSSLSRSGFFHAIDRLKHWRFLTCRTDPADRRCKIYSLNSLTAAMLVQNLRVYRNSHATFPMLTLRRLDGTARPPNAPHHGPAVGSGMHGEDSLRLPHLSCEYQILLYLFLEPGAAPSDIAGAITASRTKFNAALRDLIAHGLVVQHEGEADKRRKRCFITERVQEAIARANREVLAWLDMIERSDDVTPKIVQRV